MCFGMLFYKYIASELIWEGGRFPQPAPGTAWFYSGLVSAELSQKPQHKSPRTPPPLLHHRTRAKGLPSPSKLCAQGKANTALHPSKIQHNCNTAALSRTRLHGNAHCYLVPFLSTLPTKKIWISNTNILGKIALLQINTVKVTQCSNVCLTLTVTYRSYTNFHTTLNAF